MNENREIVQGYIAASEGGYSNHKSDPGGATDRGITQKAYDVYRKAKGLPVRGVKGISKNEADAIIYENYMRPIRFDDLPDGLDYTLADYSVNSGPGRAIKDLQRALNVPADGIFGNQTFAALQDELEKNNAVSLIIEINTRRMAFLKSLPHWKDFKRGWTARVVGEKDGAQMNDIGVLDRSYRMALNSGNPVAFADIPAPTAQETAKAPEPQAAEGVTQDKDALGTLASGGGVLTAAGGVLSSLGDLDPVAQAVAVVGLLVALVAAAYVLRHRLRRLAAGRG